MNHLAFTFDDIAGQLRRWIFEICTATSGIAIPPSHALAAIPYVDKYNPIRVQRQRSYLHIEGARNFPFCRLAGKADKAVSQKSVRQKVVPLATPIVQSMAAWAITQRRMTWPDCFLEFTLGFEWRGKVHAVIKWGSACIMVEIAGNRSPGSGRALDN